jgi:hypothetical protein
MARKKRNTQQVSAQSTQATSDVADASAQMIAPSLRKFIVPDEEAVLGGIDPRCVLGCLASRLFLAGLEAAGQGEWAAA